ncbi:MAG: hypothetical protein V8T90_05050 [Victivallales bacterium]
MNFYYGAGKIDWREFRERINRETDNDCLRNAVLAWMIGIAYLFIGVFYWKQWMAQCDIKEQVIWMLPVLFGGPVLLGICSAFSRMLGDWPRCPACGKRLHELRPTIATKRCPHCNAVILADARGIAPGYELPLTIAEINAKKEGYSQSCFTPDDIKSMRVIFVGTPLVALLFFALGINRDLELESLMEKVVQIMGGAMIVFCGIAPLISVSYVAKILHRTRLMPKNQSAYCPECGDIPSAYVARMTGNCSECGARLLASPDESVSKEMVDWHKLKRYCRWSLNPLTRIVLALIAYPLLLSVFVTKRWSFLYIAGAIFCLYQIVLFDLRRQAAIPKKCPHCESSLTHLAWTLLYYGHCPNCRRKLVRDGDDMKGGDHGRHIA